MGCPSQIGVFSVADTELSEFWGEFEHGVDDKGRVVIPADFRAGLGEEFVVTRGPDHSVLVLPIPVWNRIAEQLKDRLLQSDGDLLQRMLGGRAIVRLDPQFRLAIPKHLREWANISQSYAAVLSGQGRKIEIWNKANWDKFMASERTIYEAAANLGIDPMVAS